MIRTEDCIHDGKQLHIIKEIKPKDGKLREIHECLLGHICYLNGLKYIRSYVLAMLLRAA